MILVDASNAHAFPIFLAMTLSCQSLHYHVTPLHYHLTALDYHLTSLHFHLTSLDYYLTSLQYHLTSLQLIYVIVLKIKVYNFQSQIC